MSTFTNVNQHCLQHISALAETHEVLASEDICDQNGTKLWAKGKPVSKALQERLLSRKLRVPLELTLEVQGGASKESVVQRARELCEIEPDLGSLLGTGARGVFAALAEAPVEKALRLLLTCTQTAPAAGFDHAVKVAMLGTAMGLRGNLPQRELDTLVIAGLAHDIGELYVNPAYLTNPRQLSLTEWQHVAVHPLIGRKVVAELTNLHKDVGDIIAGHHEHEDGSGYPLRTNKQLQSRPCRLIALAEVISGLLHTRDNRLARTALALKLVPGEFSADVLNLVMPRVEGHVLQVPESFDMEAAAHSVAQVEVGLRKVRSIARTIAESHPERQAMLTRAQESLARLEAALHSTGLPLMSSSAWASMGERSRADAYLELEMVPREIMWRMRHLARGLSLAAHTYPGASPAFMQLTSLLASEASHTAEPTLALAA
jgi:HD-GYP domain-containing protein (c-di-GMP phosphodiesterase class II)